MTEQSIKDLCAPLSAKVTPKRCLTDNAGYPIVAEKRHEAIQDTKLLERLKKMKVKK